WQMVIAKCLYCLCLNKQAYDMRGCIVPEAICHQSPLCSYAIEQVGGGIGEPTTKMIVRKHQWEFNDQLLTNGWQEAYGTAGSLHMFIKIILNMKLQNRPFTATICQQQKQNYSG
ncbi:hypothetical protein JRQ81_000531, partial [Phrynocephalus forsythii]